MIILALSICSLCSFSLLTSVIFTVIFSIAGYSAVIYLKLKLAFYEDECEYIRAILSKLIKIMTTVKCFFCESKRQPHNGRKTAREI